MTRSGRNARQSLTHSDKCLSAPDKDINMVFFVIYLCLENHFAAFDDFHEQPRTYDGFGFEGLVDLPHKITQMDDERRSIPILCAHLHKITHMDDKRRRIPILYMPTFTKLHTWTTNDEGYLYYTHGKKVREHLLCYEGKLWTIIFLLSKYVLTKLFS